MPAYSFKERFIPMILNGTKSQTIRTRRRHPAKVGDTLYLYFGLRTKYVRKLREETCIKTHSIAIDDTGAIPYIIVYDTLLDKQELEIASRWPTHPDIWLDRPEATKLTGAAADLFAWKDGFRPEGSTEQKPEGAFLLMLRFWKQTHQLPWAGDIIYWEASNNIVTNETHSV